MPGLKHCDVWIFLSEQDDQMPSMLSLCLTAYFYSWSNIPPICWMKYDKICGVYKSANNIWFTFSLFSEYFEQCKSFFLGGGDETVKTFIYAKKHVNELDHKIVKRSLMLPHFISDFLHPAIIEYFLSFSSLFVLIFLYIQSR
jgi:hypothetical protein